MAIRSVSDVFYTLIARLPLLAVIAGVVWVLMTGMAGLERVSNGTEFFVGNDETSNVLPSAGGGSDEQVLTDALASGDTGQMLSALDRVDASQRQRG